jgi:hypothetical protein
MTITRFATATFALLVLAGNAAAEDSGRFVVQLGRDTTGVEQYVRTPARLDVQQVGRAPRVLRRHYVFDYTDGAVTHVAVTVNAPGNPTPTQTIDAVAEADSFRMAIHNGAAPVQNVAVWLPRGTLMVAASSPWTAYESFTMQLARGKSDTLSTRMYFLGAPTANVLSARRLGRDSVEIRNDHMDVYRLRVDRAGRILTVVPISGTQKFSVTRVAALDVDVMTAAFAATEKAGAGLGMLSPRDTVRVADAGGATLWIDYGRPAARGRVVYGGIVPYGEVWRTGANAATQFRTDKPLDFGGTVVPAGFYTLWTVPGPDGWKLLVNSQTGQWGTEHDPAKDVYTVNMTAEALPDPEERFVIHVVPRTGGGVLQLDWASTRASAEFKVAQ